MGHARTHSRLVVDKHVGFTLSLTLQNKTLLHILAEFSASNEDIQENVGVLWIIKLYHTKHVFSHSPSGKQLNWNPRNSLDKGNPKTETIQICINIARSQIIV